MLTDCGITTAKSWNGYVAQVHQVRQAAEQPLTRWSAAHLLTVLELAVRGRGWPADQAATALLHVAADPATRSPARLAEAGPWWDAPTSAHHATTRTCRHSKPNLTPSVDYASSCSAPRASNSPPSDAWSPGPP